MTSDAKAAVRPEAEAGSPRGRALSGEQGWWREIERIGTEAGRMGRDKQASSHAGGTADGPLPRTRGAAEEVQWA